jgi:tetratricopeptide (TPR) repeat protein
MKRLILACLCATLLLNVTAFAQNLEEGKQHLFAMRSASAIAHFEKLHAAAPTNPEIIYWLGQSYLESEESMTERLAQARKVYAAGLTATSDAPLVKVGMGHVELLSGQTESARQHFESALVATQDRKGNNNPQIAYAIGRALYEADKADYAWGVRLMEDAANRSPKNPEMWVLLGNLHRKANPGEGGNQAFICYSKAIEIDSAFGPAYLVRSRMAEKAQDYELQKSLLDKAVEKNSGYSAAYYDLFYYYFKRLKLLEAEQQIKEYIKSKPVKEIQDDFLYAQLCWRKADYDCAIAMANNLIEQMGANAKPKAFRLLADAHLKRGNIYASKGDSTKARSDFNMAKKNSDQFFQYKQLNDYIANDHKIRADILYKIGTDMDEIYSNYLIGSTLDTVVSSKIDFLKLGQVFFNENKVYNKEAQIIEQILSIKPRPILNDYFDLTIAYFRSGQNEKSRESAQLMIQKYPQQVYGYEWAFNNSRIIDTVRKDSIAVPDALRLNQFSATDTAKFKKQYINTLKYLASYYINDARDRDQALVYFRKWLAVDPANAATIQGYIDQIEKSAAPARPGNAPAAPAGSGTPVRSEARKP